MAGRHRQQDAILGAEIHAIAEMQRRMHQIEVRQHGALGPPGGPRGVEDHRAARSEEHTSELQSLMRISYAVFCLKKKKNNLNKYTEKPSNLHHKRATERQHNEN